MNEILEKTLSLIKDQIRIDNLAIVEFYLRSDFTFVKLNNGNIGTSANYDVQLNFDQKRDYDPFKEEKKINNLLSTDPLLLNYFKKIQTNFQRSLLAALISALSQNLLENKYLFKYDLELEDIMADKSWSDYLQYIIDKNDNIAIIGYGGGLQRFLAEGVREINLVDFLFRNKKALVEKMMELQKMKNKYHYTGQLNLAFGNNNKEILHKADVAFITGSALSNGTMEDLLSWSENCRRIIVQGPSASIFPPELFERGVSDLFTNIKKEEDIIDYKEYQGHSADDKNYFYIHKRVRNI